MSKDPSLFVPQPQEEVNELCFVLNKGHGKPRKGAGFSCKRSTFPVEGSQLTVDSWKLPDWDFKKRDLPTYARGLFTYKDPASGNYRIAIRGYDKFFNIDEVPRTKWSWIQEHTKGPYEVTVKENGCIIFISGLPDDTLLVCSKHSTGAREDTALSHAKAGEKWVDKQLQARGRTRKDLAIALREANVTAVAELCDDEFEEHILAYEKDQAGLYLHGINLNVPYFTTYPAGEVHKFADEWGFRKIDFFLKDDVKSLRNFLEEAAETGSWDGKDVEGFVIRCKARYGSTDKYWHDWFFKYKFDEPYLMFRQWRECTKAMINGKAPKMRKHEKITKDYLRFAAGYFSQNKGASAEYQQNHGIIKLRNAFLNSRGLKGSDVIKEQAKEEAGVDRNIVLVPIATIGCGKTTVAVALTKLFDWGHKQNDNITAKRGKPELFARACCMELANKPVVIADRNNHQRREREQLFKDMGNALPDARYVALHYVHEDPDDGDFLNKVRKATQDRVLNRGDNHQTIQAGSKPRSEILGIMEGFIDRFQPVNIESAPDDNFDAVIDLDPTADSRTNLETVVTQLRKIFPKLIPNEPIGEMLDEAIRGAMDDYQPDVKHTIGGNKNSNRQNKQNKKAKKEPEVEYFSATLSTQTTQEILNLFPDIPFLQQLQGNNRVQPEFHLTLIHRANAKDKTDIWDAYEKLRKQKPDAPSLGTAEIRLKTLVWDDRVMAFVAEILNEDFKCANEIPHVTVGTASNDIKPKEANDMLVGKWKKGAGVEEVNLPDGRMVVPVEIRAIMAKH